MVEVRGAGAGVATLDWPMVEKEEKGEEGEKERRVVEKSEAGRIRRRGG
jgi:hypothetical protein